MRHAAAILALLALVPLASAAEADYKAWILPKELPPVTAEQLAMKDVPFAPGARAVVLFEGAQRDWSGVETMRETWWRRVKILSAAGVDEDADMSYTFTGGWRIQKIIARTTLPDGTVVDASDKVEREKSDDGNRQHDDDNETIQVTFPQVQVGAVLDLFIVALVDGVVTEPWLIQGDLPVMESRFVLVPPNGLAFRRAVAHLPPEAAEPVSFRFGETHGHAWSFKNVPPLPDLPNMPPPEEITQSLLIVYGTTESSDAAEWKAFARRWLEITDDVARLSHGDAEALAKQVTATATTPAQKAEAIREALVDRVTISHVSRNASHPNPDAVLKSGQGASADVAVLTLAMLRAVGVPAKLALTHTRNEGTIPASLPVSALYDDFVVVLPGSGDGGKDLFYSPGASVPVGQIPWENSGAIAVVLDKDTTGPVQLPSFSAAGNKTSRTVQASIDAQGTLSAQATITLSGLAAEDFRDDFAGETADAQRAAMQDDIRWRVKGAVVENLAIEGLDAVGGDVVVTVAFKAESYATRAGQRLLVVPFFFADIDAAEWSDEKRSIDVDLGEPSWSEESVMLQLPLGTASARYPAASTMDAGAVGKYETSFESKGNAILCKRLLRIDVPRHPAAHWSPLRKWFLDMAANDDQAIVLEMRDGT